MSGGFIVIPRKDWWICCKCGNPLLLSLGIQKTFLHLLLSEGRSVSIDGQMGQAKWARPNGKHEAQHDLARCWYFLTSILGYGFLATMPEISKW
jgi:hypothetical protein